MYSITAILQKQPVAIAAAIRSLLMVAVLMGLVALDERQLAGIALGAELILGLFAISQSTPIHNATLAAGTDVKIQGTEDSITVGEAP